MVSERFGEEIEVHVAVGTTIESLEDSCRKFIAKFQQFAVTVLDMKIEGNSDGGSQIIENVANDPSLNVRAFGQILILTVRTDESEKAVKQLMEKYGAIYSSVNTRIHRQAALIAALQQYIETEKKS